MTTDDHDPTAEPWASMSRDELTAALERAETAEEIALLNEFLLDRMSRRELETVTHGHAIARFLIGRYEAFGNGQCVYLCGKAGELARAIAEGMPARGSAAECN